MLAMKCIVTKPLQGYFHNVGNERWWKVPIGINITQLRDIYLKIYLFKARKDNQASYLFIKIVYDTDVKQHVLPFSTAM